jgi:DNA-binding MarR family transcriptional regulator
MSTQTAQFSQQHQLVHDVYLLLDDGDRRVLAPLGLSPLEYAVLLQLDLQHGRRLTDVGSTLLCVKSTITRTVDRLELGGLVRRLPDPDDRRAQRLVLTVRGRDLRDRAFQEHSASIERRLGRLNPQERELLGALLIKLRDGLRDDLGDRCE